MGRHAGERPDRFERVARFLGVDAEKLPETPLTSRDWGALLAGSRWVESPDYWPAVLETAVRSRCQVSAARLQVALALYQVRHGKPAATLGELVPAYLPAVPPDPYTGAAFHYHVSRGEKLDVGLPDHEGEPSILEVSAGQGVLRCEGWGPRVFLVPVWS